MDCLDSLASRYFDFPLRHSRAGIRNEVTAWRAADYPGASPTSRELLRWWFETDHWIERADGASIEKRGQGRDIAMDLFERARLEHIVSLEKALDRVPAVEAGRPREFGFVQTAGAKALYDMLPMPCAREPA